MKSCPGDTQSFQSSMKPCLWIVRLQMDVTFPALEISILPDWHHVDFFLHDPGLNVAAPLSSHPFREDKMDGAVGNNKLCPGDMQSLPSNFGCKCTRVTHCDVTFLQDDVVLWGELRLWKPSIDQCHFTRRAGGVNEEAQRLLLLNFMDGLQVGTESDILKLKGCLNRHF